jgi:hypothetical protein
MERREDPIMHTSLMHKHLHDLANKLAIMQGSLDCIILGDIPEGQARKDIELCKKATQELCMLLTATRETFYATYRQSYDTYKGEPPLLDINGIQLKLHDPVIVPDPKCSDDFWAGSFRGEIISTTVGEGAVSIKDSNDNCWRIDAQRVTKVTPVQDALIMNDKTESL